MAQGLQLPGGKHGKAAGKLIEKIPLFPLIEPGIERCLQGLTQLPGKTDGSAAMQTGHLFQSIPVKAHHWLELTAFPEVIVAQVFEPGDALGCIVMIDLHDPRPTLPQDLRRGKEGRIIHPLIGIDHDDSRPRPLAAVSRGPVIITVRAPLHD